MNWFKHDTDASNDAKVKKLLIRHGAIGYAVYFHCLELIASDINESNITFQLEHDSEIIADNLKIKGTQEKSGIEIVEEIMHYIVELGLFDERNGAIFCFKLLKRLDTSMTSNTKFRQIITAAKESHDGVMTESCKIRRDKIRSDKKRIDDITDQEVDKKHRYGEYKHVLLTDQELEKLQAQFTDYLDKIRRLDEGIELKGYKYKNHYLALLKWAKKDEPPEKKKLTAADYTAGVTWGTKV